MNKDRFTAVFRWHEKNESYDISIPFNISANELILGLNAAFKLGMDTSNLSQCHLKAENPIALLKGNKLLREYGLHEGSIINFTQ